jgi:Glycosyltransferases, probably involved in cell wall biogenesis
MKYSLRQTIGAAVIDYPQFFINVVCQGAWTRVINRNNRVAYSPDGREVFIDEPWSSDIYICHVFPWLGRTVLKLAVKEWPFHLLEKREEAGNVDLSFIIPHRGVDRLPILSAVIKSIFGQRGVSVECIVVEQNQEREVRDLPEGVRVMHLPDPDNSTSWQKCWAFNEGVKQARGDIVVCHDGDILVPQRYGCEILRLIKEDGYDAVFPQRFLFYMSQSQTEELIKICTLQIYHTPLSVKQNWRGGTLAIRRDAYSRIGGFDERFTGWGGEDLEFYDRCLVLNIFKFGYIPFIHLYHTEQPAKKGEGRVSNLDFFSRISLISREERIDRLKNLKQA